MRTSVLVLALLALGACKSSPSPTRDVVTPMNASARITPEERASGEVMAVLRSQCVAWNRGDLEAYMSAGYWNSPELTFYSGGNATKGYDATLEHYKKSYQAEGATMGHLEFYGLETVTLGEEAQLARGHWKLTFEKKPALGGVFSVVLKRLPQGWRIVHDHTSVDTTP